jgi:hypothetical protein
MREFLDGDHCRASTHGFHETPHPAEGFALIISAEEFLTLRTSDDPAEQKRASYEAADVAVWLDVIEMYPEMREWVAYNKSVPLEVLEVLASDPEPRVRRGVAIKRKIGTGLLQRLASDVDDGVRARVARHHRASPEILKAMLEDESWVVREAAEEALASRPDTQGEA